MDKKSPKVNSTFASLIVAAIAAAVVAVVVEQGRSSRRADTGVRAPVAAAQPQPNANAPASALPKAGGWTASAPGRVEPKDGEVRIGAQMPGKVAQVLVRMNDSVRAGDVLARLADEEPAAKLAAAMTEVSVRRRERDTEPAQKLAAERRVAEDAVSNAERAAFQARMNLDRLQISAAGGSAPEKEIEAARAALAEASEKAEQERANLRRVQAQSGMPLPTRLEGSLATARAELALIETALERTRIRAPSDGTVLIVNTRAGETVTPSPEDVLMVFGDLSRLRIRAEIEERDIGKIRAGQSVVVRTDAFPGQDFLGRVERTANALGAPRLSAKGPRRPSDLDVLQVVIDLDGRPSLVPGMRVDVFFRPDATVGAPAATRAN